ncbi:MAG TPA: serine hydrolase domain-containing protein, partial [Phycisphaerales bacterium]|nr:serine hydrolase domain-containing protein [Phycisphaerales bacterium]
MRSVLRLKSLAALVVALSFAGSAARAQPTPIAERLESIRARHGLPALAALVTTADRTVAIGAAGVREVGGETPVTTDDLWHLGSCTKSMTATVAAILVEQGKIEWDTTVGQVFGGEFEDLHEGFRAATLEQLLRHRAGCSTPPPAAAWAEAWKQEGSLRMQRDRFVRAVLAEPPAYEPGTERAYSNQGYAVAGAMLERAWGGEATTWEELAEELLFAPLGMTTAAFGAPGSAEAVDQPRGHVEGPVPGLPPKAVPPGPHSDNPPAISPAGRAHMALEDWARYVREHLRGRHGRSELLPREAWEHLHSDPFGEGYGLGWGVLGRAWGGTVITHSGSNTMWYCVVWASPEKGFAVLVA